MTLYAASVRTADDVVSGLWSGSDAGGYPGDGANDYIFQLSQAQYEAVGANPLFWGSDPDRPRWKIVAAALVEQADTRRLVVFTPATVVTTFQNNATTNVGVEVRQVAPNENLIDTGITGNFDVQVQAQGPAVAPFWMRVSISAGVGTIVIQRDIVKEARIGDQGVFRVDEPLRVRVLAPGSF